MVYFDGKRYQITETNLHHRLGGKKVTVIKRENGSIELLWQGEALRFINFDEELDTGERIKNTVDVQKVSKLHKPSLKPTWKRW